MLRYGTRDRLPSHVRQIIKKMIDAIRTEGPVSVSEIARDVQSILPNADLSEPELRAAIAGHALQAGRSVDFDRP